VSFTLPSRETNTSLGGEALNLYLNDKLVCESKPTYGGPQGTFHRNGTTWETISAMSLCDLAIPVKKGDYISLESVYDLVRHPLRKGHKGMETDEMGLMDVKFVPASPSPMSKSKGERRPVRHIAL
jgi:hypothetical protein